MTTKDATIVPSTTIKMLPDSVTVTSVNKQGLTTIKNTNLESIQSIFMREQSLETPLLPSQWGVVKYYKRNQYEGYVMTIPAKEREVTFNVPHSSNIPSKTTIPIPPLLWIFEVQTDAKGDKRLTHSMMYAMKHELLSMKDTLLHAPFPNIGISHGICWGRVTPPVPTPKSLQNIPALFFSQAFNTDLSRNRVAAFQYQDSNGEITTESAVHHMIKMANDLAASKEAGETFSYPFETLKKGSKLTVESAIKVYLPNLFK